MGQGSAGIAKRREDEEEEKSEKGHRWHLRGTYHDNGVKSIKTQSSSRVLYHLVMGGV